MSLNKIHIIGNLCREPELTFLPSQTPVCEISLANNRKYKTAAGEQREDVCFVECRSYAKTAETIAKYFHKGDPICITGRLQLDSWQAQDGSKRSKHRIFVESFEFLGNGQQAKAQGQPAASDNNIQQPSDDIPF